MALTAAQEKCALRLQQLLAFADGQRWACQYLSGTETRYPHQTSPLTRATLASHVEGTKTVGLLSDGHGSTCRFGAIDVDMPRDGDTLLDLLQLLQALQVAAAERDLRTLATFSGRRGLHLILPLAFPTPWSLMHRVLRRLARDAKFEPVELFPSQGKCLKLPCGIHGATGAWSTVLPELSGWPAEQLQALANDLEEALEAAALGQPLEPDWESQAALLEAARPCDPEALEAAAGESTVPALELLPAGEHPACITALLEQGPRPGHTLNGENLNLARYCAQADLEQEDAEALATKLWGAMPEGYSTKDLGSSLKNFRSSYSRALDQDSSYLFRCSDMAAGGAKEAKKLVASGRCQGEACPCWPWGSSRLGTAADAPKPLRQLGDTPGPGDWKAEFPDPEKSGSEGPNFAGSKGEKLTRRLWRALQQTHAAGQEIRLSLVLAAAENLPEDPYPEQADRVPLADAMAEQELLAAALGPNAKAVLQATALLSPAGFNSHSTEEWEEWASDMATATPPPEDVWRAHLERLAEVALRVEASEVGRKLRTEAAVGEGSAADALASAALRVAQLQRTATPDLAPADDHLEALVSELLSPAPPRIPVSHPGLAQVLGGGFRPGQLVTMGGPPGSGKTTAALQLAEDAAEAGFPALVISMEMSRTQLMQAALSRLSGINGRDLAQGLAAGSTDTKKLAEALPRYRALASRLYLVEGGPQHTPGRLQALVGQIRHQQGLPPDAPVLVVVDYLQLLVLGADGEASMPETLRVGALATALKQLARATGATVVALSDVTKQAMTEAETGGRIGPGVFRDSARVLHACDTALVIQSGTVPAQKGKAAQTLLQLALAEPGLPEARRQQLERAIFELPHPGDTYARWTVLKNRGGQSGGEVWSIYRRHLSQYLPCLPGEAPAGLAQTLGGGGRGF